MCSELCLELSDKIMSQELQSRRLNHNQLNLEETQSFVHLLIHLSILVMVLVIIQLHSQRDKIVFCPQKKFFLHNHLRRKVVSVSILVWMMEVISTQVIKNSTLQQDKKKSMMLQFHQSLVKTLEEAL